MANLPPSQITPEARPVQDFIRPSVLQIAQPSQAPGLQMPGGIQAITQGSGGNVQGYNNWQRLAEALVPFNAQLTSTLQSAAEGAAANAANHGELLARNEALRAQAIADAKNEKGEIDFAKVSRSLAAKDPAAGALLNLMNPYREAGVRRGLAKLAGESADLYFQTAYNGLKESDVLSDPKTAHATLARVKAQVQKTLSDDFGISPGSPGFINYTAPKIVAAGEKLDKQFVESRQRALVETIPIITAARIAQLYSTTLASGVGLLPEVRTQLRIESLKTIANIIDVETAKAGPGDSAKLHKEIFQRLIASPLFKDQPDALDFFKSIPIGPKNADETRSQTLGDLYGLEELDAKIKYETAGFQSKTRDRDEETSISLDMLTMKIIQGGGMGNPQKAKQVFDAFIADLPSLNATRRSVGALPLSASAVTAAFAKIIPNLATVNNLQYTPNLGDSLLIDLRSRVGTQRDEARAANEIAAVLKDPAMDPSKRDNFSAEAMRIVNGWKSSDSMSINKSAINAQVTVGLKAVMAQYYGTNQSDAITAGVPNPFQRGTNEAQAMDNVRPLIYKKVEQYIKIAETEKGGKLSEAEAIGVVSRVFDEFSKLDKNATDRLFPSGRGTDTPAVKGQKAKPSPLPPGSKANPTYNIKQLDDMPDRNKRLTDPQRAFPVLSLDAITEEIERVAGQNNNYSPEVKRAAMTAKKTPANWLIYEAGYYQGLKLNPLVLKKLKSVSMIYVPLRTMQSATVASQRPSLARASSWMLST